MSITQRRRSCHAQFLYPIVSGCHGGAVLVVHRGAGVSPAICVSPAATAGVRRWRHGRKHGIDVCGAVVAAVRPNGAIRSDLTANSLSFLSPAIHFMALRWDGEVRRPVACEAHGVLARALRRQIGMGAQTPVVGGSAPARRMSFSRRPRSCSLGSCTTCAIRSASSPGSWRRRRRGAGRGTDDLCERHQRAERELHVLELSLLADLRGDASHPA